MDARSEIIVLARTIAIVAPAIYTGVTFAYSGIMIKPMLAHAPPKLLARQWLEAYQYGPIFVPPLVFPGAFANLLLAFLCTSTIARNLYLVAGLATLAIMPFTLFWMEPGINGAAKFKAHSLLKDEGLVMAPKGRATYGVRTLTAKADWSSWAESVEMKDIVEMWGRINDYRWMVTAVASVLSGVAAYWH